MISLRVNEWDTFLERSYTRFVYHCCFFLFISSYVCFSFAFWLTQTDIGISQHQHSSGNNNATRHNSIKIEPIMNKMMMNRIQWKQKKNLQCMQWQNVWDLFSRSQQILYGNHITQVAMHICSQLFYSMRSIFYNKIKNKMTPTTDEVTHIKSINSTHCFWTVVTWARVLESYTPA